jgi:hypothetical protein
MIGKAKGAVQDLQQLHELVTSTYAVAILGPIQK